MDGHKLLVKPSIQEAVQKAKDKRSERIDCEDSNYNYFIIIELELNIMIRYGRLDVRLNYKCNSLLKSLLKKRVMMTFEATHT